MGFNRPGISFEFAPAPAGFKWEKQEDGSYKLKEDKVNGPYTNVKQYPGA